MSQSKQVKTEHSCSSCSSVWQKQGTTNCWGDPDSRPAQPSYCPSKPHAEMINASFQKYLGDDSDAHLARVAAKIEGQEKV